MPPSKKAPNENAISNSCSRRSVVTPPMARFNSSNLPVLDRDAIKENDVSTIQPIGKKPTTTPSSDARTDMPTGMVYTTMVMMLATIRAMSAAMCAFTFPLAIKHQQRDHRNGSGDRRHRRVAERIIDLIPHCGSSPRHYAVRRPA